MSFLILQGDARHIPLKDESVSCVCTSPPYWSLRSYLDPAHKDKALEIGLEKSFTEYVSQLVTVFREVWRVLHPRGVVFLNLADSYRKKQLCGVPWKVAFALQEDGWILRGDIIWAKRNGLPESVTDRCSRAHEYIFHLTKNERYFWDQDAVREPHKEASLKRVQTGFNTDRQRNYPGAPQTLKMGDGQQMCHPEGRNVRTVWTIATEPFPGDHFATMPTEIVKRCILAGTSEKGCCAECGAPWVRGIDRVKASYTPCEGSYADIHIQRSKGKTRSQSGGMPRDLVTTTGWQPSCSCNAGVVPSVVFDPFGGSGTTVIVADRLGRRGIAMDLSRPYCEMSQARARNEAPLFVDVPQAPIEAPQPLLFGAG